jgi:hypothetical protein
MTPRTRARRRAGCPTDLALNQLATGERRGRPGEDRVAAHVSGCADCSAQVSRLETLAVPAPDPVFWAAMSSAAPRRHRPLSLVFAGTATAAALGALVLFVLLPRSRVPGSSSGVAGDIGAVPGVRSKGSLALGVLARRVSGRIDRIDSGGTVAPGDTLRFEVAQAAAGFVVVVGLDARPSVAVYAPQGELLVHATAAGKTMLPEAVVADETPGIERIIALSCPTQPASDEVRAAATRALAAVRGHPDKVGNLGLPCLQSAILITKATSP